MNPARVQSQVDQLRLRLESQEYDERPAHIAEDQLHRAVLAAIAAGTCDDPRQCAAIALETRELGFARRYG